MMEGILFGPAPIRWIQELFGLGYPLPFRAFSLLGDTWGILLVVGVALWLHGRETAHAVIGIVIAGAITKLLLGMIFYQARPTAAGIVVYEQLQLSSFPSGHVYQGVAPWLLLYALGCVRLWVPALVAVLISLGRLYLGTHYLGDVLAGVVFAAALVWIYHRLWPSLQSWLQSRSPRFYRATVLIALLGSLAWLVFVGGQPRRYEIVGMTIGGSLGLLLEAHFVRRRRGSRPWPVRAGKLLLGAAGIVAFLLLDRSGAEDALLLGTLTAGVATLWTVLAVPLVFSRITHPAQKASAPGDS